MLLRILFYTTLTTFITISSFGQVSILKKAVKEFYHTNYTKCIELSDKAINKNPKYVYAYLLKGEAYEKLKDTTRKIETLKQCRLKNPDSLVCHYDLALFLQRSGQQDSSFKYYNEIISKDSTFLWAHNNRGVITEERNNINGALSDYLKERDLQPNEPIVRRNLATIYVKKDMFEEAIEELDVVFNNKEVDILASDYVKRGYCYGKLNRFRKAMKDLNKSLEYHTEEKDFYTQYYKYDLYRMLRFCSKLDSMKSIIIDHKTLNEEQAIIKIKVLLDYELYDTADSLLIDLLKNDSTNATAYSALAYLHYLKKDTISSLRLVNKSISLDSTDYYTYVFRANIFISLGKFNMAKSDLDYAKSLDPGNLAFYYYCEANYYFHLKKFELALNSINQCIFNDQYNYMAYFLRAKIFKELGRLEFACQDIKVIKENKCLPYMEIDLNTVNFCNE